MHVYKYNILYECALSAIIIVDQIFLFMGKIYIR